MTLSGNPSGSAPQGTSVSFTASISPSSAVGTVTFRDNGTILGTVSVSGGSATISSSSLTVGNHQISATFTPTSDAYETSNAQTTFQVTSQGSGNNGNTPTQPVSPRSNLP